MADNGNLPEGWKKVKLGEIAELSKSPWNPGDEVLPYIGLEHIGEGTLRLNRIGKSSEVKSNKFIFTDKDFLFGKLRPYFRKLYKPKFKGVCSTDIWVVRPKKGINRDFLFYLFATQDFVGLSYTGSSGTRMPRADWNFMQESEWLIPEKDVEQKAIASVLSSLDDKIDLLHRQNKTLEQMAETLFRKWFIEEAEEDWEEVTFGEFVVPKKGKNITRKECVRGPYPVVAGGIEPSCFHNKCNTQSPVVTISASGVNAGFVKLYTTPVWSSDSSFIDYLVTPYVYFAYIFLKVNQSVLFDKQTGSAQPHIYPAQIMELECLNYPEDLIKKFEEWCKPLFKKIKYNHQQIHTLEKLRDTLLPKIMSGEVKVRLYKD